MMSTDKDNAVGAQSVFEKIGAIWRVEKLTLNVNNRPLKLPSKIVLLLEAKVNQLFLTKEIRFHAVMTKDFKNY